MRVTFNNHFGTMPVEETIRSIFDQCIAGQPDSEGVYYCIHSDHKTHEWYALSKENEARVQELGHPLNDEEGIVQFNGELVRLMTFEEECAYNEDRLMKHVDLWGNVAVDEPFDTDWYLRLD